MTKVRPHQPPVDPSTARWQPYQLTLPAWTHSSMTGDHLASLGSLKVVDHFVQKCRNIKDIPGGRHTLREEQMILTFLALQSHIAKVGDMVSVNSVFRDPLTLRFEQIDQISSLELINLYISKFAEKCRVDRPRSSNDREIDICRFRSTYWSSGWPLSLLRPLLRGLRPRALPLPRVLLRLLPGDIVVGGPSRST